MSVAFLQVLYRRTINVEEHLGSLFQRERKYKADGAASAGLDIQLNPLRYTDRLILEEMLGRLSCAGPLFLLSFPFFLFL